MIFFSASTLIILFSYFYQNQRTYINNAASQQLSAIAELKVSEINNWRNERIGDASVIYKNNVFASDVMQYFNNSFISETKKNILSLLSQHKNHINIKTYYFSIKKRKFRLALNKYDADFGKVHSAVINDAVGKNNIVFSDFYKDNKDSNVYLSIAIPIVIFQKSNTTHIGTVMIILDPNIRLYPTIKLWPVPSETGRHFLCVVTVMTLIS